MKRPPATLVIDPENPRRRAEDWEITPTQLRWLVRTGNFAGHVLRYPSARLLVEDIGEPCSAKALFAARLLARGPAWIEDRQGRTRSLSAAALARTLAARVGERRRAGAVVRVAQQQLAAIEPIATQPRKMPAFNSDAGVLFLRIDEVRGLTAGGSLAHLAGVINGLCANLGSVDVVTTDPIPLLDARAHVHLQAVSRNWRLAEIHQLELNGAAMEIAAQLAPAQSGRLVYQRYSAFNWIGVALARQRNLPFVLEFNGSMAWLARNWDSPLRHEALAARIERMNLMAADLVSVVSEPLRAAVLAQGIAESRVLVNPNGVDADRFTPERDGAAVRRRHDLGARCVIGFVGTFGPWHGAEVLAEAFARLLERRADLRETTRLLLVGDGVRLPHARDILARRGWLAQTVITGTVPQQDGAEYMAACDILCVPTVPNPDGTVFFGSPTKLFEGMAAGRALVASSIGQVADVLVDQETALLVPAGDAAALERALQQLVDHPDLRQRLGTAARARVVSAYTWNQHVRRLLDRLTELQELVPPPAPVQ